jgi:hypothetical protein
MNCRGGAVLLFFVFAAVAVSGICQLRNLSDYGKDCINTDKTYFILRDAGSVEFAWASEWTHLSANNFPDKAAMVIWHFKNGLKAYSPVIEHLGDAGGVTGYFLTGKSSGLKDARGKNIQPMTLDNHPVKIELCLGDFTESTGFSPDTLIDTACLDEQKIEYNHPYYFSQCGPGPATD